jgi:hypothetical protein
MHSYDMQTHTAAVKGSEGIYERSMTEQTRQPQADRPMPEDISKYYVRIIVTHQPSVLVMRHQNRFILFPGVLT